MISGSGKGEQLAMMILEGPLAADDANVPNLFDDAGRGKDVHAIGPEAEGAAHLAAATGSFEYLDGKACLLEKESKDGAGDAASDNENTFGRCVHFDLPHKLIISITEIIVS
jgi:hypothetical protein